MDLNEITKGIHFLLNFKLIYYEEQAWRKQTIFGFNLKIILDDFKSEAPKKDLFK